MRARGRLLVALGCVAALCASAAPRRAAARGSLTRAKRLTSALEAELAALAQLDDLSRRVLGAERRLQTLTFRQTQLDDRIAEGERRIRAFEKRRGARRQHLRRRLRSLYKLSRGGLLRLMLESESADQARRQTRAVARILARDAAELRLFRGEVKRLATLRDALRKRRAAQAQLLASARVQSQRLTAARDALSKALGSLYRDRRRRQRAAKALSYAQKRLLRRTSELRYRLNSGLGGTSVAERKGRLPRPARGYVLSCFGAGAAHKSGIDVAQSGMLLRPRKGA
ncbi:MAG: hypothetical protein KC503_45490, partial [Myxococcales bacterium]|nr:hypothetical protein [Myxococcales bacterium]